MSWWKKIAIFLIAFFLQIFFGQLLPIISPNFILVCTVVLAFMYFEDISFIILGAVGMLIMDLMFGIYAGAGMLALLITAIIARTSNLFISADNFINVAIITTGATVIYPLLYWLFYLLLGVHSLSFFNMIWPYAIQLVYNLLIAGLIYLLSKPRRTRKKGRFLI